VAADKLTPRDPSRRDFVLAAALCRGATWEEAGREAGCSKATVRRRMQDEAFRGLLREARRAVYDATLGRIVDDLGRARVVLVEIMEDPDRPAMARVGAARTLAGLGESVLRFRDSDVLSERVERLEALLAEVLGLGIQPHNGDRLEAALHSNAGQTAGGE
jgi:hypothetical protein